jgi:sensor domain CHASE-containing protein
VHYVVCLDAVGGVIRCLITAVISVYESFCILIGYFFIIFIVIAVIMTQKGMKHKALSLKEKLRVIREVQSNPTLTRVEVAKRLNMPVTTVERIMGKKAFNKLPS